MRSHRAARVTFIGLVVLLISPVAAGADVGAGVGASPIELVSAAHPGHTYQLPSLYVVNTGTVTSTYHMRVERLNFGPGITVPPAWVRFARNDIRLAAKKSATIAMTLSVPAGAGLGSYKSDLVVGTVAPRGRGSAVASAQAATELEFEVAGGGGWFPWPLPGWLYALLGGVATVCLLVWAQRRYGVSIRLERR